MRKVLVSGAGGFVAANLVRRLISEGFEVHGTVREQTDRWRLADIEAEITLHSVDLQDQQLVAQTVAAVKPEWIFHVATHGAYSSQTDRAQIIRTNVSGSANLLSAAVESGCDAFINTGTSSEYGAKDHAPSEDEAVEPNSYYAATKAAATELCRLVALQEQLPVVTLRLYSVYGPWEEPGRLLPSLVASALSGTLPQLSSPDAVRDFIYIDDVVDAYLLAAENPTAGAIYNVGCGRQTRLDELVELCRSEFGINEEPQWDSSQARPWEVPIWVADPQKITNELGWQPRHDLRSGLRELAEWMRGRAELTVRYG